MGQGIDLIETRKYEDGFVGASERKSIMVTVAKEQDLKKFCPLGRNTETGEYSKWVKEVPEGETADGTEIFRGVLISEDVKTTTATATVEMCIVGEFDADFVSAAYGEVVEPELYGIGIITRKVVR